MQLTDGEIRDVVGLVDQVFELINRKIDLLFNGPATTRTLGEIDEEINLLRARMMVLIIGEE
jgi:hypothetical protein